MSAAPGLRRLLAPTRIAVVGGADAEKAVHACRSIGFRGPVWAVNPRRKALGGVPCVPDVATLPEPPDAAFVSVPPERTVEIVAQLRRLGAGGVVVHASGFAEDGARGAQLQRELVDAAGGMPLLGPNCLGLLNYLDAAALWPDQHGGTRTDSGVALLSQSGNVGQNLTMQRRGLPVAYLLTLGNAAVLDVPDVLEALLQDGRVTAVGMYLESLPDAGKLARVAGKALRRRVPLVALKVGASAQGARATLTHTSSLAGSDAVADALFRRLGIARVPDLGTLLETLMLLHVHGALPGARVSSASCSGGEAAMVADLAAAVGVELPELPGAAASALREALGDRVAVSNPLDYHTYAWGRPEPLTEAFGALMDPAFDLSMLVLDLPRDDRCDATSWTTTRDAFVAAGRARQARAAVVSSLPEGMPEAAARELVSRGVAPLRGIGDALRAVSAAARIGAAQVTAEQWTPPAIRVARHDLHRFVQLDEAEGKRLVAAAGVATPRGLVALDAETAAQAAAGLGGLVVVKALSATIAHKSDVGGVITGLTGPDQVRAAAARIRELGLGDVLLVEEMVADVVAELLVGVHRDAGAGLVLTLGAGGVLVEMLGDTAHLLLPVSDAEILQALRGLRVWPLLAGFRGRSADLTAVVDAVSRIAALATDLDDQLAELEINPLLVGVDRAVAVDVLVRLAEPGVAA